MKVEVILYKSKQAALPTYSADGMFTLTMRAFDRSQPNHTEPWFLIFCGDAAADFWHRHGNPPAGAELCVQAHRLRCMQTKGKACAEIHANVTHIFLHITETRNKLKSWLTKPPLALTQKS